MKRDIDQVIAAIKAQVPNVQVEQLRKTHPADDDGIWWFKIAGSKSNVQVESSSGNCPFLIETDSASDTTHAVAETVHLIELKLKQQ